jgi:hypothetical protein
MAYLEITLQIDPEDRAAAAGVYGRYKPQFLAEVPGARSKDLLVRDEDVQVLHGFDSVTHANDYLASELFTADVARSSGPCFRQTPKSASSTSPSGLISLPKGPHAHLIHTHSSRGRRGPRRRRP